MILHQTPTNARKTLRTTRTAFTLLEVLVVVAIIVMLAGVGGYYLFNQYELSKVSIAKAECKALAEQVDIYKVNKDETPNSLDALVQAEMMSADKIKDPWGKPYQLDASGAKPRVFTTSPKGVPISNFDKK